MSHSIVPVAGTLYVAGREPIPLVGVVEDVEHLAGGRIALDLIGRGDRVPAEGLGGRLCLHPGFECDVVVIWADPERGVFDLSTVGPRHEMSGNLAAVLREPADRADLVYSESSES